MTGTERALYLLRGLCFALFLGATWDAGCTTAGRLLQGGLLVGWFLAPLVPALRRRLWLTDLVGLLALNAAVIPVQSAPVYFPLLALAALELGYFKGWKTAVIGGSAGGLVVVAAGLLAPQVSPSLAVWTYGLVVAWNIVAGYLGAWVRAHVEAPRSAVPQRS